MKSNGKFHPEESGSMGGGEMVASSSLIAPPLSTRKEEGGCGIVSGVVGGI